MEKLKYVLQSRKFWAAVIGIVFVLIKAFKPDFPLSEEQVLGMILPIVAYILGVAIEDGLTARFK